MSIYQFMIPSLVWIFLNSGLQKQSETKSSNKCLTHYATTLSLSSDCPKFGSENAQDRNGVWFVELGGVFACKASFSSLSFFSILSNIHQLLMSLADLSGLCIPYAFSPSSSSFDTCLPKIKVELYIDYDGEWLIDECQFSN